MEIQSKILVVDDDRHILAVLLHGLESYGFAVTTCENATDAQLAAVTGRYDYILTDHNMPGMDGVELVRRLRHHQPRAVIIGMSGKDASVPFLEAGANDFVQKPFVADDIVMMIRGVVRST